MPTRVPEPNNSGFWAEDKIQTLAVAVAGSCSKRHGKPCVVVSAHSLAHSLPNVYAHNMQFHLIAPLQTRSKEDQVNGNRAVAHGYPVLAPDCQ